MHKFPAIRSRWQTLVNGSTNPYVMYQSALWWDHLLATTADPQLSFVIVQNDAGEVMGLSPVQVQQSTLDFCFHSRSLLSLSLPVMHILGSEPFLPKDSQIQAQFFGTLSRSFPQCSGIYLKSISRESPWWEYFENGERRDDDCLVYRPAGKRPFHRLILPSTFDEYLLQFSRKKRYNLKRQERLLREYGGGNLELRRVESPDMTENLVSAVATIEANTWQQRMVGTRIVDDLATRRRMSDLAERGVLRSYLLRCGDAFCAYVVGYQFRNVFHYSDVGFDERFAELSPGSVLLYMLIADLIENRRPSELLFGIGYESYKEQFANRHSEDVSLLLLKRSPANYLRCGAHATFRGMVERARRLVAKDSIKRPKAAATSSSPVSSQTATSRCNQQPSPERQTPGQQTSLDSRPLRVCFMVDKLFPAGIELQLLLLVKWLDRSRVIPSLCLLDGTDDLSRSLEPDDCPVIRLGVRRLRAARSIPAAWRLARFFRREKIDIVHPLFPDSLYFGATVAKIARVPCVAGFRVGLDSWEYEKYPRFARLAHRAVDGTVTNCDACRQAVIADHGAVPESVAIIPNGVDLSRFNDVPALALRKNLAEQCVGIVANLRPVKNIELFIRAAAGLAAAHPHVKFQVAGEGDLRGKLQGLIDGLGLGDRVALLGTVVDIPAFLAGLDVAVLCSLSEGSPNAIMEYMAAGLPTVATDVGGNGELVENEQTGLLVPPNSEEYLTAAIDRLLRDRPFAARLGATARQRAFELYSVETQARRYENFYHDLLRNRTRAT